MDAVWTFLCIILACVGFLFVHTGGWGAAKIDAGLRDHKVGDHKLAALLSSAIGAVFIAAAIMVRP